MYNHEKVGKSEFETICCDVGVMRRVLEMMSEELIGHKVVVDWIKSGGMQHHLPS